MELATKLMHLFRGHGTAYGIYSVINGNKRQDGKIKGKAATIKGLVTVDLWRKHIKGEQGLGIVPITEESTVYFGAIDVDVYMNLEITDIIKKCELFRVPVIPTRSKSGGCHLYLFVKEPVTAALMQKKLKEIAATIGYGDCEIYPRQTEILVDRGDIGQWLNMPYFDHVRGGRYGVKHDGTAMTIEEYVELANAIAVTPDQLSSLKIHLTEDLVDGPPCLQHLITQGFPEGTRNDGLFNLGVYARMAFPDMWKAEIETFNAKYMNPPLKSAEIQGLVKALSKKDYMYTCSKSPIKPHCNSDMCRARKYGVGNNGGMPVLGNLAKFCTDPPLWFLDVEGKRMELVTEDLQSQARFQKRCMECLNMMPPQISKTAWQVTIQHLMDSVQLIEASSDGSPQGQLIEMLERFCTQRAQASIPDEILLGRPYFKNGRHIFRLSDFLAYLERHHFREFKVHSITAIIRYTLDGKHDFINIKGKGVNTWSIPEFTKQEDVFDIPNMGKEVPY